MTPIECLQKQLDVCKGALQSSTKCCQMETISVVQHVGHKKNLDALIKQYETAIVILKKNPIK